MIEMAEYPAEAVVRGWAWYHQHEVHVDRMVKSEKHGYPMSGSDVFRPELWKPTGWKWFLEKYGP